MSKVQFSLIVFISFFLLIFTSHDLYADLSSIAPATTKVKSCQDFFTYELNNPVDMSDYDDINNYFEDMDIGGYDNPTMSGGIFSATANVNGAAFYLWSPMPCGAYPVGGRYGQNLDIDTTKYDQISYRMYTDKTEPWGVRLLWDRDCNYAATRTGTEASSMPVTTGWQTVTKNFSEITVDSASNDTRAWSEGSITGFAILATTQAGANIKFDYVRLEDSSTCASNVTVNYSASADGDKDLVSLWLDNNSDPFDGYIQQLKSAATASGAGSATLSPKGLAPGSYKVIGLLDQDYRTLEASNPWDMNDSSDIYSTGGMSNETYSSGVYSATCGANCGNIYLQLTDDGIDPSKYDKLSVKLSRSGASGDIRVYWFDTNGGSNYANLTGAELNGDVYELDLAGRSKWAGTIEYLVINPGVDDSDGLSYSLDFVALTSGGYVSELSTTTLAGNVVNSASDFVVNDPPLIDILEPGEEGGELLRPWNMANTTDLVIFDNLNGSSDPNYTSPAELYTTWLPDVRTVDGVRGDFFKGTSVVDDDDPICYSTFPYQVNDPISFSASDYKNLCYKLNVAYDFSLSIAAGSVARVIWKNPDGDFETSEDLPIIYSNWLSGRWHEVCIDMTDLWIDGTKSGSWDGTIEAFRVDPSESNQGVTFYYDYIKLAKDDLAPSTQKFNIVYTLTDSDDDATVNFYYNTSESTSGGTLINSSALAETRDSRVYTWDTSGITNGTYYVYAVASDGYNETRRLAKGKLVVNNTISRNSSTPILSLEAPTAGSTYCNSSMQVKGFALQEDRYEPVAAVEVLLDNNLLGTIRPSDYSIKGKTAYSSVDSSNAGFDVAYDISGYADGEHTVKVIAYSTDGESTQSSFSITKGSSNCADDVVDPDPAGTPVPIDNLNVDPSASKAIIHQFKMKKNGLFKFKISNALENDVSSCTLTFYIGADANSATNEVKSFTVTKAKNNLFQAKKMKIDKNVIPEIALKVKKACTGYLSATSDATTKKVKSKKGVSTIAEVVTKLAKKLKKKNKKKKKK